MDHKIKGMTEVKNPVETIYGTSNLEVTYINSLNELPNGKLWTFNSKTNFMHFLTLQVTVLCKNVICTLHERLAM